MLSAHPHGSGAANSPRPLVIAHRGAWARVGQNTLAAFEAAIALGADMIEFDVRRTRDGRLVIHHDARAGRVATAQLDYRELRAKVRGTGPPLLDQVLELAHGRVALDVELKEPGYVREVLTILRGFGLQRCVLTSFLDSVLLEAKLEAPELQTGLLVGAGLGRSIIARVRECRADYAALGRRAASASMLARVAAHRIACLVWTVNDVGGLDRYLSHAAVAGVITDRPALALERRARIIGRTGCAEPR